MPPRPDPIPAERLSVLPATSERWPDVVTLLGGSTEQGCWCQAWRGSSTALGFTGPGANRHALEAQVTGGAVRACPAG